MDLSYLYHRHGVSLTMAAHAACERSRKAHQSLAAGYANRIAQSRRTNREIEA